MNFWWIGELFNRINQRRYLLGSVLLLVSWCLISPLLAEQNKFIGYKLGPGDAILIKVENEPDLTLETKVSAQGTIHFVFLGEVSVDGLTIHGLQQRLEKKLADGYLRNPKVNVLIKEYRIFFVQGEVKNPGGFPFQPNLTIRKAIVLAGGFTDTANKSDIVIIRGDDKSFSEKSVGLDERILPGDVVTIQESFW